MRQRIDRWFHGNKNYLFQNYMPKKEKNFFYNFGFFLTIKPVTCGIFNHMLEDKQNNLCGKNQGLMVVFHLVYHLKGHNVTCDNFFCLMHTWRVFGNNRHNNDWNTGERETFHSGKYGHKAGICVQICMS